MVTCRWIYIDGSVWPNAAVWELVDVRNRFYRCALVVVQVGCSSLRTQNALGELVSAMPLCYTQRR